MDEHHMNRHAMLMIGIKIYTPESLRFRSNQKRKLSGVIGKEAKLTDQRPVLIQTSNCTASNCMQPLFICPCLHPLYLNFPKLVRKSNLKFLV